MSSSYVLGTISLLNILSELDEESSEASHTAIFGGGIGYQWRIKDVLSLRVEGQYRRMLNFEDNEGTDTEYSLIIGLGTRFGNNTNSASLK